MGVGVNIIMTQTCKDAGEAAVSDVPKRVSLRWQKGKKKTEKEGREKMAESEATEI